MALLTPEDLEDLLNRFKENNETLNRATGMDIKQICEAIYGTSPGCQKVGIIPITAGNGVISNFSASLLAIVEYFGLEGFITPHPDITGYYEAICEKADIILMADDHIFIAHNLRTGKIATNHVCTGVIYAEIASLFKEAASKDVLVIGLGRVGYAGAAHLTHKGFNVFAYDPDEKALERAIAELGVKRIEDHKEDRFSMVFEATPNADTISEGMISERCLVSTPGIPCGLPDEISEKYDVDLVMEPLVIGVSSMLYAVF